MIFTVNGSTASTFLRSPNRAPQALVGAVWVIGYRRGDMLGREWVTVVVLDAVLQLDGPHHSVGGFRFAHHEHGHQVVVIVPPVERVDDLSRQPVRTPHSGRRED